MSGFSSPALGGGGALIRPSAHSPNYAAGTSGWTINKDGSAEFNNLTLRGSFFGASYIVNNAGAFFYSGTPANGNLICSIASAAGVDSFGNAYLSGFSTYSAGTNTDRIDFATGNARFGTSAGAHFTFDVVNAVLQGSTASAANVVQFDAGREALFIYSATAAAGNLIASIAAVSGTDSVGNKYLPGITTYNNASGLYINLYNAQITQSTFAAGVFNQTEASSILNGGGGELTIGGPTKTASGFDDYVIMHLVSGVQNGTTGGTAPFVQLNDGKGNAPIDIMMSGNLLKTNNAGQFYTWQSPSYNTGWAGGSTASASYQTLEIHQLPWDAIWLFGAAHATVATPSNTVLTLPVGYRPQKLATGGTPAIMGAGALVQTSSTDTLKAAGRLNVQDNGVVVVGGFTIAASDNFYFNHIIPLGNLP